MQNVSKPSPQWVRETLCEDLADLSRLSGKLPDTRAIESVVDQDIKVFQAHEREDKPRDVAPTSLKSSNENAAKKMAEDAGHEFFRREIAENEQQADDLPVISERHKSLLIRIACLLQVDPTHGRKENPFRYPGPAADIISHRFDFINGRRDYRGKSVRDKNRIYLRAMEDIADRSTGLLGQWR